MKTAVEWLVEQLDGERHLTENEIKRLIQQAKEMEKEQIVIARINGDLNGRCKVSLSNQDAEQYYNETFKSE